MPTADYQFYTEVFHGKMAREDFDRLAVYASAYLEELTMGRITDGLPEDTALRVKKAQCAVTEVYLLQEQGGGVAAESNDGVSVTYVSGSAVKGEGQRLYEAAALFLGPTGLLYRGVR